MIQRLALKWVITTVVSLAAGRLTRYLLAQAEVDNKKAGK